VVHGRREPRNFPIMLGVTFDQMLEPCDEIADGVVLNYCTPLEHNDRVLDLLENGARKSGRKLDLKRPQLIVYLVGHDHDRATEASKMLHCQYLALQVHIAKTSGVSRELVAEI
jgi:5,10-methylenetetrahydromethanopterin reductase